MNFKVALLQPINSGMIPSANPAANNSFSRVPSKRGGRAVARLPDMMSSLDTAETLFDIGFDKDCDVLMNLGTAFWRSGTTSYGRFSGMSTSGPRRARQVATAWVSVRQVQVQETPYRSQAATSLTAISAAGASSTSAALPAIASATAGSWSTSARRCGCA
ncbi:MAG: hypothetical protein OXH96_13700 [Spirochaetaceae bacterium]|nr:hypothetical protein [Spirochaetaceae bacterium]